MENENLLKDLDENDRYLGLEKLGLSEGELMELGASLSEPTGPTMVKGMAYFLTGGMLAIGAKPIFDLAQYIGLASEGGAIDLVFNSGLYSLAVFGAGMIKGLPMVSLVGRLDRASEKVYDLLDRMEK